MKFFFQILGIVTITILTLSINVKHRPIFTYIYKLISPVTIKAQKSTENFLEDSVSRTNSYSKKIFDNSVPRLKDSVKSEMSATKRDLPLEYIPHKEKEQLDELIKSHH